MYESNTSQSIKNTMLKTHEKVQILIDFYHKNSLILDKKPSKEYEQFV